MAFTVRIGEDWHTSNKFRVFFVLKTSPCKAVLRFWGASCFFWCPDFNVNCKNFLTIFLSTCGTPLPEGPYYGAPRNYIPP